MRRPILLAMGLAALTGCQREGTAACYEFVETYGGRLVECGVYLTQEDAEAALEADIAASTPARVQSCEDIWGLRDRYEFRDECLPALETLDCAAMALPASCEDQLLYE
jgi:hypothetical protein